jgi:hypothetical protein
MKILHTEKKGPKLNTLDRFHIYDMTKRGLQMNDTFMGGPTGNISYCWHGSQVHLGMQAPPL